MWVHAFDFPGVDDVVAAARRAAEDLRSGTSTLRDIRVQGAGAAGLATFTRHVRGELIGGPGVALLRGLPARELDDVENQALYWFIGLHLGIPIHQDRSGSVLVRVRDQGLRWGDEGVRSYETAARLELSAIDGTVSYTPISARNRHGRLFSRYGRTYVERAAERDDVAALTSAQIELLDLYDEITNTAEFVLNMDFRPGDVQLLDNHTTMHARTEYVDGPDPASQRELLRLWLVLDQVEVPEVFEDCGFVPRTVALGSRR